MTAASHNAPPHEHACLVGPCNEDGRWPFICEWPKCGEVDSDGCK